jgi:protein-tyrosine phosphatase
MVRIDQLQLSSRRPLWLSSHPLDGVQLEKEFPEKITEFLLSLREREIGAVTVLLPESELNRSQGDIDLLQEYRKAKLDIIHFPLENFSTPVGMASFDQLMEKLLTLLTHVPVLVHCRTGCGRTAMVAAGVLIKDGMEAPKAIYSVHKARSSSRPTVNQVQFLRDYHKYLTAS